MKNFTVYFQKTMCEKPGTQNNWTTLHCNVKLLTNKTNTHTTHGIV